MSFARHCACVLPSKKGSARLERQKSFRSFVLPPQMSICSRKVVNAKKRPRSSSAAEVGSSRVSSAAPPFPRHCCVAVAVAVAAAAAPPPESTSHPPRLRLLPSRLATPRASGSSLIPFLRRPRPRRPGGPRGRRGRPRRRLVQPEAQQVLPRKDAADPVVRVDDGEVPQPERHEERVGAAQREPERDGGRRGVDVGREVELRVDF